MSNSIQLPVGRFVSGSLTEKRTQGHDGKSIAEDKQRFEFGVAVDKNAPELPAIFGQLQAVAMEKHAGYPSVTAFQLQGYSWKISDGDKPNAQGQVNPDTARHFVFWFSSSYPVRTCDQNNTQCDPNMIKRGFYVDVVFNAKNNEATGTQAGIYLNPEWLRFIAYGQEIVSGRSAADAFGAPAPTTLPAGASATPLAGQAAPGMAPAPAAAPGMAPAPAAAPGMAPAPAAAPGMAPAPAAAPVAQAVPGNVAPVAGQQIAAPATPAPTPAQVSPTVSPGNAAPAPAHDLVNAAVGQQPAAPQAVQGQPLPGMPS